MLYDLSEFLRKLPIQQVRVTIEHDADFSLHAVSWYRDAFKDMAEFIRFTDRYACVLQPYIADPARDDLNDWFVPDESADERAAKFFDVATNVTITAHEWIDLYYPPIAIDWLNASRQAEVNFMLSGERSELYGCDSSQFYCVFAAHPILRDAT